MSGPREIVVRGRVVVVEAKSVREPRRQENTERSRPSDPRVIRRDTATRKS